MGPKILRRAVARWIRAVNQWRVRIFLCFGVGFPALGRLGRPQFGLEAMKTLKVVGQAHQLPFEGYFFQSAH